MSGQYTNHRQEEADNPGTSLLQQVTVSKVQTSVWSIENGVHGIVGCLTEKRNDVHTPHI